MFRLTLATAAASMLMAGSSAMPAMSAEVPTKTALKPFNVTIRVFDPTKGLGSGVDYTLPVDSPDAEHAAASTLANAGPKAPRLNGFGSSRA